MEQSHKDFMKESPGKLLKESLKKKSEGICGKFSKEILGEVFGI